MSSYVKWVYPKVNERVLDLLMNDCALVLPMQPSLSQLRQQTIQTTLCQANRQQLIKKCTQIKMKSSLINGASLDIWRAYLEVQMVPTMLKYWTLKRITLWLAIRFVNTLINSLFHLFTLILITLVSLRQIIVSHAEMPPSDFKPRVVYKLIKTRHPFKHIIDILTQHRCFT